MSGITPPPKVSASEVARIKGGGLVHVIVTSVNPFSFSIFLNGDAVQQINIESFSIIVESGDAGDPISSCVLSSYVDTVTGARELDARSLFPCSVEIVALDRRIRVVAEDYDNPNAVSLFLGLLPDGSDRPVSGAKAFRFVLSDGILDAKLTWNDGTVDDLFK